MFTRKHLNLAFLIGLMCGAFALLVMQINRPTLATDISTAPPRPTLPANAEGPVTTETTSFASDSNNGAKLSLKVQYDENWPFEEKHWQDVYIMVRWADQFGNWHPVEGWQGNVDEVGQENLAWVSHKEWWVGHDQMGSGPYRWFIYDGEGGEMVFESESFFLPEKNGEEMVIKTTLRAP